MVANAEEAERAARQVEAAKGGFFGRQVGDGGCESPRDCVSAVSAASSLLHNIRIFMYIYATSRSHHRAGQCYAGAALYNTYKIVDGGVI